MFLRSFAGAVCVSALMVLSALTGGQAAVLVPGTGWTQATAPPPQQGTGPASDKQPIARWDAVPCQAIADSLNVAVVAFHINGIEKVSFSLNNGPWLDVTAMTLNPEDSVVEYWATFKANTVPDGPVEIRAIAYPVAGVPRVLDSLLVLYANAGQTLPTTVKYVSVNGDDITGDGTQSKPYQTIGKATVALRLEIGPLDGATIYLLPGDHEYLPDPNIPWGSDPVTNNTYLNITAAPGITADQVGLVGGSPWGLNYIRHVHISNVTVKQTQLNSNGNFKTYFWIEHTTFVGGGITDESVRAGVGACTGTDGSNPTRGGTYITGCEFCNNCGNSVQGRLIRNTFIHNISGDAFETPDMIVNTLVDTSTTQPGQHSDVYQNQNVGNNIIYGLTALNIVGNQGLSLDAPITDLAVVNTTINITESYHNTIWGFACTNVYLLNSVFTCANGFFSAPDSRELIPDDFVFENCYMEGMGTYPGVTFRTTSGITQKFSIPTAAMDAPGAATITYDLIGRIVRTGSPAGQNSSLPCGLYFIETAKGLEKINFIR